MRDRRIRKDYQFINGLVPLAFAFEFGYQLKPQLERLGDFFPILGRQLGISLELLGFLASSGAAKPWQIITALFGLLISLMFLKMLIKNHQRPQGDTIHYKAARYLPLITVATVYWLMFVIGEGQVQNLHRSSYGDTSVTRGRVPRRGHHQEIKHLT